MTNTQQRSPGKGPPLTGCLTRIILPLLKAVKRPYHLYPIGVLFGLGFDTASTITLLSVAAIAQRNPDNVGDGAGTSRSDGRVILLALLFTAGMTLVDSADSIIMMVAYARLGQKRDSRPVQSLEDKHIRSPAVETGVDQKDIDDSRDKTDEDGQNGPTTARDTVADVGLETIRRSEQQHAQVAPTVTHSLEIATGISFYLTLLSVLLAFAICIIEVFGIIASQCSPCAAAASVEPARDRSLNGRWWAFWAAASDQLGYIGAGIVGIFVLISAFWWLGRRLWENLVNKHTLSKNGGPSAPNRQGQQASKARILRGLTSARPRLRRRKPHRGLTLLGGSIVLIGCEILANVIIWVITAIVFVTSHRRSDLALAVLAWTTGLRHGLDADHISAIDNSIRRFLALEREEADAKAKLQSAVPQLAIIVDIDAAAQQAAGQDQAIRRKSSLRERMVRNLNAPVLTGLYFSLGHSTIVLIATIIIAITTAALSGLQAFGDGPGGYVGTIVSASFLGLVGLLNSILLGRAWMARRRIRQQSRSSA